MWILGAVSLWLVCIVCIGLFGWFGWYTPQALVANLAVVIPANTILTALYLLLTPIRWIASRITNLIVTRLLSFGALKPSIWTANWSLLLEAFPIAYKKVLHADILNLTESEAREVMDKRCKETPFPQIREAIAARIPPWVHT